MKIKYQQKFHSVGQGLFYSSSLSSTANNLSINIIFDCGSENVKQIDDQVYAYNNTIIDVLTISHLHYDHVSGLESLLRKNKVNTVILPYLFPEERLLFMMCNSKRPKWYLDFLNNPYSYLVNKGNVEKVVIINGDDENSDYSINMPELHQINENEISEKKIDIYLERESDNTKEDVGKREDIKFGDKLHLYKDKGYVLISNVFLSFFYYKIKPLKIDAFKKEISNIKIDDLLSRLKENDSRELIKNAYKIISSDLNCTSLSAYQGLILQNNKHRHYCIIDGSEFLPNIFFDDMFCRMVADFSDLHFHVEHRKDCENKIYCRRICECCYSSYCSKVLGTLLLGDIKLDYKDKKQKELFTHFKNLLPSVKWIQLSHHGADNGWNDNLIDSISKNSIYLSSHGEKNRYQHPHKKVLLKLAEKNRKYISVTEKKDYNCEFSFDI
ncbi:MAG: MBL fold metallo-hydrolase [Candidatus Riflebacteria bacterium]|nr:MBL fold metallo-hydrolase [Candidatus Riflebacteria bacterium]